MPVRILLIGGVRNYIYSVLSCLLIFSSSDATIPINIPEPFNINQNVAAVQKGRGITTSEHHPTTGD
jgi:hypothetical protein